MPLPLPNLDDRRFDDLVAELRARLASHVPEWELAPGDPGWALIDVLAWLAETILYRANLIPERQRRAFLDLLGLPLRAAAPARGVVCIDSAPNAPQPVPLLPAGSRLRAGAVTCTTETELQPSALELLAVQKARLDAATLGARGVSLDELRALYNRPVTPFEPRALDPATGADFASALDGALWLALLRPRNAPQDAAALRAAFAGRTLSLGLAPDEEAPDGLVARALPARSLKLELVHARSGAEPGWLALEILDDRSLGARQPGVLRFRLPANALLAPPLYDDPKDAGLGVRPPALPAGRSGDELVHWLRLSCPDAPGLKLAWLGFNAVDVVALDQRRDVLLAVGDGRPDQVCALPDGNVDAASLLLEVETPQTTAAGWERWSPVERFAGATREAPVYALDAASGRIRFGDGIRGRVPAPGRRIRAVEYRHGGGAAGNLGPGQLRSVVEAPMLRVRHERALRGGADAETVAEAERRLPDWLNHRERAVTAADFRMLALETPGSGIARAEVVRGLIPGDTLAALQRNVPGAVAVFVLAARAPDDPAPPRPGAAQLREVWAWLRERCPIGTELYVLSPRFVPLAVSVAVGVRDPAIERETLLRVEAALRQWLSALHGGADGRGWPLGRAVDPEELRAVAARVDGVVRVPALGLFAPDAAGRWLPLPAGTALALLDVDLPELRAVSAGSGNGVQLPAALTDAAEAASDTPAPAPVVPDLC